MKFMLQREGVNNVDLNNVDNLKEILASDPRAADLIHNKHAGSKYVATGQTKGPKGNNSNKII